MSRGTPLARWQVLGLVPRRVCVIYNIYLVESMISLLFNNVSFILFLVITVIEACASAVTEAVPPAAVLWPLTVRAVHPVSPGSSSAASLSVQWAIIMFRSTH